MAKTEPVVHIPVNSLHAVRMSNRQYGQLKYLMGASKGVIALAEVAHLNQTTLGGNKRRGWVTETPHMDGVLITHEGREAVKAFENGDFFRKVDSMKFSSFLSLETYEEARNKQVKRPAPTPARSKGKRPVAGSVRAMKNNASKAAK